MKAAQSKLGATRPKLAVPAALNPPLPIRSGKKGFSVTRNWGNVSEPWLSADDIATHLGVSKDTVYAWISTQNMPAHKIGRLWKFQTSEVDDWVRQSGASPEENEE